jgi:anti-anti-sigma regulatory factor
MTLRIERSTRRGFTVFTLSGRIEAERVAELKELFELQTDYQDIILDLREVRLADRDAVRFLRCCEANGMKLENCPAYMREWMKREKD